jgi:lysophospholipase L1-like esterase
VLSDPVDMRVVAGEALVVSADLASPLMNDIRGGEGFAVATGHQAMQYTLTNASETAGRPLASAVEVLATSAARVIITFGDSITDGNRADLSVPAGWPAELARRLRAQRSHAGYAVVNAGIGGNRLLAAGWGQAGLARLDRDVLRMEGVSHLILLEGINDIGMSGVGVFGNNPELAAEDLIFGYRQVIVRARARGVKVFIGTLTPTGGSFSHSSPTKDAIRSAVNHWIRTSREPDGVIDFDAVTRDPAAPERLRPEYDSGDHLHPNDAGYRVMGQGIDLRLFAR